MTRSFFSLLVAVVFVLLFTGSAQALRVAIVGDSHAQVLGPMLARAYASQGHTVTSIVARPGWSSRRFRTVNKLSDRIGVVDVVVVILGGNNRRTSRIAYSEDIVWLLTELDFTGADSIVWFGPLWADHPFYQRNHVRSRDLQESIFLWPDIRWVDMHAATERYGRQQDGVHYTRRGYRDMVRDLFVPVLLD